MNPLKEIPPTAGWPLSPWALAKITFRNYPENGLEKSFGQYLGAAETLLAYSGTAAFYLILESLKRLSDKKTVVIPAFVCPLVPLAIARAGLKVKVCDLAAGSFDFDPPALEKICANHQDILAVVAVHLGGIPAQLDFLRRISAAKDIFLIEDCAQSLGAQYRGKKTGSVGDFSFFSLCRGKGLTIYEGGIAAAMRPQHAGLLASCARQLFPVDRLSESLKIAEVLAYSIFYRPALFWLAYRLPQIFWEAQNNPLKAMGEYFQTDFPLHRVSAWRAKTGYFYFERLQQHIEKQRQKAAFYMDRLENNPALTLIREACGDQASYPYLGVVFDQPSKREEALKIFANSGLGVSRIYLEAITDYPYLKNIVTPQDCPQARRLAANSLSLSTSDFLKASDMEKIINRLERI